MNNGVRRLIGCSFATVYLLSVARADNSIKPLQSVLNKTDYNLVYPAQSNIFAGGILVADKKHSSFYGLPVGVAAQPASPVSAAWAKTDLNSSFSLQALISGIGTLVSGGLGVSHTKQLGLEQINASGFEVAHPELVIENAAVKTQITSWLGQRYSVYIVHTALSTSNISVTSSSSTGVTAAFGTTLPACPAGSTPAKPSDGTGAAGTGATGSTGAATGTGAKETRAVDGTPAAGNATSGAAGKPTASLQACLNSSSKITLSTAIPLVFAASLNPVTLGANGVLQVGPVLKIAPGGAFRDLNHPPKVTTWKPSAWPQK
jgi:hypothetical protein